MCQFQSVLGSGDVLALQLLTVAAIASSIVFWIWTYIKNGLERELWAYAAPILFWVVFGTLDIVITARGTFLDPMREGNPLARMVFVETGFLGPVVASVLWIALWSSIVLAMNKARINGAGFFSLAIFWSLGVGHLFGFSSWFMPFCGMSENYGAFFSGAPSVLKAILIGSVIAAIHRSAIWKDRFG